MYLPLKVLHAKHLYGNEKNVILLTDPFLVVFLKSTICQIRPRIIYYLR